MDPTTLVDASTAVGLPAPVWFIELFTWLGFCLHLVPMNLWLAGILLSMLLALLKSEHGRRFSARLMAQMPVIMAVGINFGIVPLLFIQVGFSQIFYPATILMAWFWFLVIVFLLPAYYGVYVYASGLAGQGAAMPRWKRCCGWLSAALLVVIGFTFANAMSLMENVKAWPDLWQRHSFHGAALGTALNCTDLRLWPRWLLMFGLALSTTAAWLVLDAAWFARRESPAYCAWAKDFAWKLYAVGAVWFAVAGAVYSLGTWTPETRHAMFLSPWVLLTLLTAAAPAGVWAMLWLDCKREGATTPRVLPARGWAALVGLAQFGVLGLNAASRQVVQHLEIGPYFNILSHSQRTETQWAPLLVFLLVFVLALAAVAWMIYQIAKLPAEA
jgi:hypothetical protein